MQAAGPRTSAGGPRPRRAWRRGASLVLFPLSLFASACDEAPAGPDPALVDAVAELHLADAVAETDSLGAEAAAALRRQALALHGLDSAALAARLRALAAQPDALGALYDSVALQLTLERQGARRAAGADSAAAPGEPLF